MINTGQKDWEITQFHHYNEISFRKANITLDPFTDKTEAENSVIQDKIENTKNDLRSEKTIQQDKIAAAEKQLADSEQLSKPQIAVIEAQMAFEQSKLDLIEAK